MSLLLKCNGCDEMIFSMTGLRGRPKKYCSSCASLRLLVNARVYREKQKLKVTD